MAPVTTCSPAARAQAAARASLALRSITEPATVAVTEPVAGWHCRPAAVTRYSPRATAILKHHRPHRLARAREVPRRSPPSNTAGAPGAGAAGTSVALVAGFNGQPYGSGTSTSLGAAGGQAMASPGTTAVPGRQRVPAPPVRPAGNLVGNGTTGGRWRYLERARRSRRRHERSTGWTSRGATRRTTGIWPGRKRLEQSSAKERQGQQGAVAGGLGMQLQ